METTEGIIGIVAIAVGLVGSFISRWNQTNPELPWYIRLARVLDATQIVDSTRKLDD